jgi:hypothetical protein
MLGYKNINIQITQEGQQAMQQLVQQIVCATYILCVHECTQRGSWGGAACSGTTNLLSCRNKNATWVSLTAKWCADYCSGIIITSTPEKDIGPLPP